MSEEPHRVLVDAVLARRRRPGLWEAAVRRHMELAEVPESAANEAVTILVNQLLSLREDAEWFRNDARLRERAIAETLLYSTELGRDVPSRPAQEAWSWYFSLPGPGGSPAAGSESAKEEWLRAWDDWAAAATHDSAR
jgi:hypothetical protein